MTHIDRTPYFKVSNRMSFKREVSWNHSNSCSFPLPQRATHLASGCSHPDRGHLPIHGECNQMEGAFPTQLPKAQGNHLESLEHDCSSWGGWGSALKAGELRNPCSSIMRIGLQFQSGGLKSVPYSLAGNRSKHKFFPINIYYPCVRHVLEPQGKTAHVSNLTELT